jgi:hypothetical protein
VLVAHIAGGQDVRTGDYQNPKSRKGLSRNPPFRSKFQIKMCVFLEPVFLCRKASQLASAGQYGDSSVPEIEKQNLESVVDLGLRGSTA